MTIEEYSTLALTATPENFQSVMTEILENVKTDFSTMENYKTSIEEKDKKISDLQESNQKIFERLFLTQSNSDKEKEEEEEEDFEEKYEGLSGEAYIDAVSKEGEKISLEEFMKGDTDGNLF